METLITCLLPFLLNTWLRFLLCPRHHVLCQQSFVSTSGIQPPNLFRANSPTLVVLPLSIVYLWSPGSAGPSLGLSCAFSCSAHQLSVFFFVSLPNINAPLRVPTLSFASQHVSPSYTRPSGMNNSSLPPQDGWVLSLVFTLVWNHSIKFCNH